MKKVAVACTLTFILSTTILSTTATAQVTASEKFVSSPEEIKEIEIRPGDEKIKEIEIRPSDGDVKVQVQTEQQKKPVQSFPISTENRKIVEIEVRDIITNKTSPVSLEQTPQGEIEIKDNKVSATTALPVKVVEQEISVEVKAEEETIILPSQAVETVIEVEPTDSKEPRPTVLDIELLECEAREGPEPPECKVVYKIETEEENKLLGLIPVKSNLSYEINATNGQLLTTRKPWYLKILPFLFT
jgi:hypothetical protein